MKKLFLLLSFILPIMAWADDENVIAEMDWTGPYGFFDESVGATCEMTSDGIAITNTKVQENLWTVQTQILKDAKLKKNHNYKVIVTAKIPSAGELQVNLSSWSNNYGNDQSIPVGASDGFQNYEFLYEDVPVDAEDGHVLFQNGGIVGTCVVRSIRIIDMGEIPVNFINNILYPNDLSTHSGKQPTLAIAMNNDSKITAIQFDLVLPEGITVANGEDGMLISLSTRSLKSHTIAKSVQNDGSLRIICSSNSSAVFSGNEGSVIFVKLDISKDLADGEYIVAVNNIELSSSDGTTFHPENAKATITLGGVIAGEIVITEKDWTGCTEADLIFYEFADGQEGSVTASEEGIVITLPELSDEIWQPQTMILTGAALEKGQDYTVRITAKIPSDGQLQLNMGSFSAAEHKVVDVTGSDDFQTIDIEFPDFPYADAQILFQSGFIVGTCVIQKVQILGKVNIWTLAGDESLLGVDWDVTSTINNMITLDGEVYTLTKKNLSLSKGTYHFKVYKNNSVDESYPSSDATLVIDEEGVYTVKFTFNANAKELSAIAMKVISGEFETAAEAVKNMKIGWNLFNTLDSPADPDWYTPENYEIWETAWGQPVTKPELMKLMRKAGFNAIRVPVTWYLHMDSNGKVDPLWMKRVHEVVDYVIDQGMYCLLNTHHDTMYETDGNGNVTRKAKLIADKDNYKENKEWFENLWRQIAEEFKDYDEHLLFEGYNEMADKYGSWFGPNGDYGEEHVQQAYDAINDYAQSFVNAVRSTGGKNLERNLVVSTYTASLGPGMYWGREACRRMKVPQDVTTDHIAIEVHCYWQRNKDEVDDVIFNIMKYLSSKDVPTIIGEWGAYNEGENHYEDFHSYFIQQAKANDIATFLWGGMSDGIYRIPPFIYDPEDAKKLMKAYYGDEFEPTLLTKDDYDFQGFKVSYDNLYAEFELYHESRGKALNLTRGKTLNLTEYKGIRVELEKADGVMLKVYGESDGKEQYCGISSPSETISFDKSVLGNAVRCITLQNSKEGKNDVRLFDAYLIRNDGTEERIDDPHQYGGWQDLSYELIMPRKQYVHTVAFDGLWSELNIFNDDVPLKLKNYKGIRLELAEMPKYDTCHLKVYGDGEKNTDDIGLTGTSTTITFNPDIFSTEINRITLISDTEDKFTTKVLCAYLIRQDGTEEYSNLSPFHNCEIIDITKYDNDSHMVITIGKNGKTTFCGDIGLDFSGTDEVKAFIATGFDKAEGTIWMTRVKDVPAGVPVMIKGDANMTYNIPVTDGGTSYYKNMFVGNTSGETVSISTKSEDGKYDNYYLSSGQFKSVNGSANIGNNKCYLQLPADFEAETTGETLQVKIASSGKSSFAAPYDLDFTDLGDAVKAFTATGFDKSTSTIWLTRVKKVQKGEGLLLKGTGGETYTIPSKGVRSSYENMIVGNISGETLEIGETAEDGALTNYYLSGGTYVSVKVSANIGNNKSYLQLPTFMLAGARSEDASDKQSEYSFAELETEPMPLVLNNTTGVVSMDNGELDKDSDEWYSLSGQRIDKPTKKGLYIHNGKKIVVK